MLGKTHFTMGIATALVVSQPSTIPGVLAVVAAGGIGGKLPDIDQKRGNVEREKVYDSIIEFFFIGAILAVDFFIGNGICRYVADNWGVRIWIGLAGIIILSILGIISHHRSFTHSFVCLALYGVAMYFFCYPIAIPFTVGYLSHILLDLFNKTGMPLFFPIRHRFCLKKCGANGKANKVLYWIGLAVTVVFGAVFFSRAFLNAGSQLDGVTRALENKILGFNALQVYLAFTNIITFFGFQRSWKHADRELSEDSDKSVRIQLEFETWILDFLAFAGGGVGMLLALLIHLAFPSEYNGNWWSICYTSILSWFTIYCYICNPFHISLRPIVWFTNMHILLFAYVIAINVISAALFSHYRKRHLNEYNSVHTLLWLVGAIGGTVGAYPVVIVAHRDNSFNYAVFGFPLMFVSQILFLTYIMSSGIL